MLLGDCVIFSHGKNHAHPSRQWSNMFTAITSCSTIVLMWMYSFLKTVQFSSVTALYSLLFFPLPVAKWRLLVAFLPSSTWCVRKHTAAICMQAHSVLDSSLYSSHPRCFKVQSSVFPVSLCSFLSLPPPFLPNFWQHWELSPLLYFILCSVTCCLYIPTHASSVFLIFLFKILW